MIIHWYRNHWYRNRSKFDSKIISIIFQHELFWSLMVKESQVSFQKHLKRASFWPGRLLILASFDLYFSRYLWINQNSSIFKLPEYHRMASDFHFSKCQCFNSFFRSLFLFCRFRQKRVCLDASDILRKIFKFNPDMISLISYQWYPSWGTPWKHLHCLDLLNFMFIHYFIL